MSAEWKLVDRESGEVVKTFDVGGMTERERGRMFDGMVRKIDFERFYLDRGEGS